MTVRLEDILFTQGFGTRHECSGLISLGRVTFDGVLSTDPDSEVNPQGKVFSVEGTAWPYHEKAVIVLNKPAGYECSQKPTHHPSVMTLLPPPLRRRGVQPVGRLDADTTGLLLLTDDGALLHRLTHPKKHVPKTYVARCAEDVSPAMCKKLTKGVLLDGEKDLTRAASCEITDSRTVRLVITSGKYHQVKRMIAAAGNRVEALQRTMFGAFDLPATLIPGAWDWLNADELALVQKKQ